MSTYAGLLYSCGKGGLHKAAKKIHRHMLQSYVTPTTDGFTGKNNVRFTFHAPNIHSWMKLTSVNV